MGELFGLIVWAGLISGGVEGTKAVMRAIGWGEKNWFIRALPVLPFLYGSLTAPWILPSVLPNMGLVGSESYPAGVHAVLGFGIGGLTGGAYKVLLQTIMGKDDRITK